MSTTSNPALSSVSTPGNAPIGNFDQPVLPILDPQAFGQVRSAIEACFSSSRIEKFLASLNRAGLRIRDFERVLTKGKLGEEARAGYGKLGNGDQGQIREFYLGRLETVAAPLRNRFFKLYAYY